jgi:hypothetical protein
LLNAEIIKAKKTIELMAEKVRQHV